MLCYTAGPRERAHVYKKAKELCHMSMSSQLVQAVKVLLQLEGQTRELYDHCAIFIDTINSVLFSSNCVKINTDFLIVFNLLILKCDMHKKIFIRKSSLTTKEVRSTVWAPIFLKCLLHGKYWLGMYSSSGREIQIQGLESQPLSFFLSEIW